MQLCAGRTTLSLESDYVVLLGLSIFQNQSVVSLKQIEYGVYRDLIRIL